MKDWSDEQWVKLYRRDTADWLLLSWRARGLFYSLLRIVDRAGVLDLGRTGKRAVAVLLGAASECDAVVAALDELIADGCVRVEGQSLVLPNFVAAQEAVQSDKARARASRERRRAAAMDSSRDDTVTNRDASITDRDDTVTSGHDESRGVTKRREEKRREGGSAQAREASPSGGSPSGAHSLSLTSEPEPPEQPAPPKPAKAKRPKPAQPPDVVPAPGTIARKVYDAIVTDRVLGPIVAGPGDASERWADPATFPGVDVLAEVRRAGEYAATRPGQYTDGRAFLRKWLQTCADRRAAAPRAHSPHRPSAPADDREAHITVLRVTPKTAEEHEREQREIAANRAEFRRKLEALKAAEAAKGGDA